MPPKRVTPRGKAAQPPEAVPPAPKKTAKKKPAAKRSTSTTRFIRNLHGAGGGVRFTLTDDTRIKLEPRGHVGDIAPVSKEQRDDPIYIRNNGSLFEELTVAQAKAIMEKQTINAQAPRPTVYDHLLNERGEKYQRGPVIEKPFEQQGQVVAHIEDGPAGRFTDGHQGMITRANAAAPEQVAVPGSVQNPGPQVPSNIPPEQVADWVARNTPKGEDAQVDLGLRAQIAPVERDITPGQ